MAFDMFCDYHTPTIRYIRHDGEWSIIPATADGWRSRREWKPSPALEKSISRVENLVIRYPHAIVEQMYGIPKEVYAA